MKTTGRRAVVRLVQAPRFRIRWPLLIAIWLVAGLLLALDFYLDVYFPVPTEYFRERPLYTLYTQLSRTIWWALLTPVVFELGRRIPLRGWRILIGLPLHGAFALVFMMWILHVRMWSFLLINGVTQIQYYGYDLILGTFTMRTLVDFYLYFIVLGIGMFLQLNHRLREQAISESRAQARLAEAQLSALRQQVHPHFLHNALNAIAELVRNGQNDDAVEAIVKMSELQRALLQADPGKFVPLEQEIEFNENYLALERIRFEDRLKVEFDIDPAALHALVPTLVLQPLVENATKHGIALRIAPGRIAISARRQGERLHLRVVNDLPEEINLAPPRTRTRVGVANLRARLQQLYGDDFRFTLELEPRRDAVAEIDLPFRSTKPTPSDHARSAESSHR